LISTLDPCTHGPPSVITPVCFSRIFEVLIRCLLHDKPTVSLDIPCHSHWATYFYVSPIFLIPYRPLQTYQARAPIISGDVLLYIGVCLIHESISIPSFFRDDDRRWPPGSGRVGCCLSSCLDRRQSGAFFRKGSGEY